LGNQPIALTRKESVMKRFLMWMQVALFALCLSATPAQADVELVGFDPASPFDNQTTSLVMRIIRGGGITTCEIGNSFVPPIIEVSKNVINAKLYLRRIGIFNAGCDVPSIITSNWQFSRPFPAGQYVMRVFGSIRAFEPNVPASEDFFIGEIPLTVRASTTIQAPGIGLGGIILTVLMVSFLAALTLNRQMARSFNRSIVQSFNRSIVQSFNRLLLAS
jgi:hypothetical protein